MRFIDVHDIPDSPMFSGTDRRRFTLINILKNVQECKFFLRAPFFSLLNNIRFVINKFVKLKYTILTSQTIFSKCFFFSFHGDISGIISDVSTTLT